MTDYRHCNCHYGWSLVEFLEALGGLHCLPESLWMVSGRVSGSSSRLPLLTWAIVDGLW